MLNTLQHNGKFPTYFTVQKTYKMFYPRVDPLKIQQDQFILFPDKSRRCESISIIHQHFVVLEMKRRPF